MTGLKRSILLCAALSVLGFATAASAANTQQEKMKSCNAEAKAKSLSGSDRQDFMKHCLSAGSASGDSLTSQQQKMKTCNAEAKTKALKGADRKQFMSSCLKGS
jgi:opacity protein-like surface antigen